MSDYESLSVLVSTLSAFVALWAIIVSRKTANEQKLIAHRTQHLEARNLAATHHGKYSELLFAIQSDAQDSKNRLVDAARDSLDQLCRLFDQFGGKDGRPTRHIFHELCDLIFQAFRPQLTWQTGMRLAHRFVAVKYVEDDLTSLLAHESEIRKRASKEVIDLRSIYRSDPNQLLESIVLASAKFQLYLLELGKRIPPEAQNQLLQAALVPISAYAQIHENERTLLEEAQMQLQRGLDQNALEEFPLSESPALLREYKRELAKLNALEHFSLSQARHFEGVRIPTAIAELLYFGGILFTVQMHFDWGNGS